MASAAEAHSIEIFMAPYQKVAGIQHRPVRLGVPADALAAAQALGALAGKFADPAPPHALPTTAPKAPIKTISAAEYRLLKHSHITNKLDPSERLASPQTESHVVGWRARETWTHSSKAFSEALQGRGIVHSTA